MHPVDTALDVALIVIQNGGSTRLADHTFANVLKGFKKEGVSTVWRLDFVTASVPVEGGPSPITRAIGEVRTNLVRVQQAAMLGERAARGEVNSAVMDSEIARIAKLAPPYNRWVMMLAAACAAAFFSRTASGDWGAFGIAFAAAGIGQCVRSFLPSRNLSRVNVTFICSVISALIATAGLRLGFSQVVPATLIASIIYMVPGIMLINGFVDIISSKYLLVGIERLLDAALLFLILTIAVALADAVM
jgi:uncharacterized membrane protein YjjP (DUF1212 family)